MLQALTAPLSGPKRQSPLQKQPGINPVLLSFILGVMGAAAIFLPFVIVDKGFYLYAGDYNQQQIPFNYYLQGFIKDSIFNGGGTWSWATDIGSSAINSYSFYNLGSPFFWLVLLLPQRWMPYLMVPLFCLKFGCIAAAASLYFSRYSKSRNLNVVVSLVYAFCGFNLYNIFFNHMLEPVVIFPLMLWALDGFVYEGKRGWFAIFVGLSLINSYFFFAGNAVFLVLYFFVKLLSGEYRITLKGFGLLVFEAILGICLGMVLLMPAVLNLMGNPRTSEHANGMGLVTYYSVHQYFNILWSMFIPPDTPWMPNLFREGTIKWTSMSLWLPIVSMSGVIAYCRARKKSAVKWLLAIMLVCMLVPFLNSAFYAFNSSYYARWYYMPIILMCFATLRSLEDADIDLLGGIKVTAIITALYAVYGLLPVKEDEGAWSIGVAEYQSKFWLTFCLAMLSIAIFYILVKFYRHKLRFAPLLLSAVMGFSVFFGVVHVSIGKFTQWERDGYYKEYTYDAAKYVELHEDIGFYRIDDYNLDFDNLGLWLNKSGLQSFNSVITTATMDFHGEIGLVRDVRSNPDNTIYALRGLWSVLYTFVPENENDSFVDSVAQYGWTLDSVQGSYYIYSNDNFIPLGFTYDEYLNMDYMRDMTNTDVRTNLLVRAIGLEEEQIAEYGYLFDGGEDYDGAIRALWSYDDAGEGTLSYEYDLVSYDTYVEDAAQRAAAASYYTEYDSTGFTVRINLDRENLVFFGVPYDEGFTATVDGAEAEVIRVSGGMMAVLAPAGDHEIVFTYKTPGFGTGGLVTLAALVVLAAYMLLARKKKRDGNDEPGKAAPVEATETRPGKGNPKGKQKQTQQNGDK